MAKQINSTTAKTASELGVSYEHAEEIVAEEDALLSESMKSRLKEEIRKTTKVKIVRDQVIEELLLQGQKKYGKGRLYRASEKEELEIPRISSGLAELDEIIGGGLPLGKIIEVFGEESTGKSSLMYHVMQQVPQTLYVDSECTFDEKRLKQFGLIQNENVYIARPETAEATLQLIYNWANAGIGLIVLDSVMAMIPKATAENDNFEKADSMALIPRLLSQKLPMINDACGKSGTILVLINQMRSKVGMVFGNPLDSPGGRALKHFASLRIQTGRKGVIEDDKIGEIGQYTVIRVVKSKVSDPHGKAIFPFIYDTGFVTHEAVPDIIDARRIAAGGKRKRRKIEEEEEA